MRFEDFRKDLANHGVKMLFFMGRILLEGKNDTVNESALEHYREMIGQNPQFEAWLIREWAKEDSDSGRAVKFSIEERIAIQEAEGLQSDERTAILSSITQS